MGRSTLNDCEVAAQLPETLTKVPPPAIYPVGLRMPLEHCDLTTPFLTQVKGFATYMIPRLDVQVAATFQSRPYVGANFPHIGSQSLIANWVVPSAVIAPSLGRNLAAGLAATATLPLMEPGTAYGNQFNKLDLRVTKIIRVGGRRMTASVDVFNLLNGAGILQVNTTYGPEWLNPTSVMVSFSAMRLRRM